MTREAGSCSPLLRSLAKMHRMPGRWRNALWGRRALWRDRRRPAEPGRDPEHPRRGGGHAPEPKLWPRSSSTRQGFRAAEGREPFSVPISGLGAYWWGAPGKLPANRSLQCSLPVVAPKITEASWQVMTSNHPEKLDPALIRPGRIDKTFHLTYMVGHQASEQPELSEPLFQVLWSSFLHFDICHSDRHATWWPIISSRTCECRQAKYQLSRVWLLRKSAARSRKAAWKALCRHVR